MNLSASEQATLHFYEWERRLRGYYHFDTAVALEPYYKSFDYKIDIAEYIDDGKVPSILDRLESVINPKALSEEITKSETNLLAHLCEPTTELVGFSLVFPGASEIQPILFREWLSLVSFTKTPISFEIIGSLESIRIQIVSNPNDCVRIQSQFQAHFPTAIIKPLVDVFDIGLDMYSEEIAIIDFGLSEEVMRPLQTSDSLQIDPLTSIIATMDRLQEHEVTVFQMLFQGVQNPWARDLQFSVSDGQGGSFFTNCPEMPQLAQEKTKDPLFAVVIRIAVESNTLKKSEYLATELIQNIGTISQSGCNKLIPLDNDGYSYNQHLRNVFLRCSNRLGFLAHTRELTQFLHYPNKTVISSKLGLLGGKTKALPIESINQPYVIGINEHNGLLREVSLNDEMRLKHTHIIGATGVGKSTLIANMVLNDAEQGNGAAIFDPHGDICEDILARIPEHRINDVVLIDPSDLDHPIGFNLLGANTEVEKIVLSSDLVSSFKRHATAWGDNMTAVLSNAINTFLENPNGGTIIELKRFILEEKFRNKFLQDVNDPSLQYYWKNEYPMVKKGITPLLTRIDTFLRPKTLRYMVAQRDGLDFRACIEEKKIVLIKLSQGLIGEDNSYLLGSLFLSKFNQVAIGRQSIHKSKRHPYYIYLDEFQNFITPSIKSILSGARKYGLGLTLAHQELAQIDDPKMFNSVISNPNIRICFRLGDIDAKRLESGFSYFEHNDLQSLGIGRAIMRISSSTNDFNIQTASLPEQDTQIASSIRSQVIEQTRVQYCSDRSSIEKLLTELLPNISKSKRAKDSPEEVSIPKEENTIRSTTRKCETRQDTRTESEIKTSLEQQKVKYLESLSVKEKTQKHRSLQEYTRTIGLQRGFKATIEEELTNDKRIDVTLINNDVRIAIEISVTNTVDYEIQNIQKCLDEDYHLIFMISDDAKHLTDIKKGASKHFQKVDLKKVLFLESNELTYHLDATIKKDTKAEERVNGWRVEVNYHPDDLKDNQSSISKKILNAIKKKNK